MKEVQWQVEERFVFQPTLQKPQAIKQLNVTPQFTEEMVEGRPSVSGIYHVAVTCALADEQMTSLNIEDQIPIDTIDLQGSDGYFEYAVPFHIDFPPEAAKAVDVNIANAHAIIEKDGCMQVAWDVTCHYQVEGIQAPEKPSTTQQSVTENDAKKAVTEERVEESVKEVTAEKEEQIQLVKVEDNEEVAYEEAATVLDLEEEQVVYEEEAKKEVSDDHVRSFFQQLSDGTSKKSFISS